MGTDALGVMNAVRVRQGREPINPYAIEGFGGPNDPPPPPLAELPEPINRATEDDEFGLDDQPAPSPLVPATYQAPVAVNPQPSPAVGTPDLMVADRQAMFQGHAVVLDEIDVTAIATVILRAAERQVRQRLSQLGGKRTRQRRAARVQPESEQPAIPAAPRKRGRPKGSKNKPKVNGVDAVPPATPA